MPVKTMFEEMEVNVPNDTHICLTNLYVNDMQMPSEDKRERHLVYKFSLTKEL